MIIYIGHLTTITEGLYLAFASPRLVIHNQIMYRHPNLMYLLIFACGIMDLIPLIACNTAALVYMIPWYGFQYLTNVDSITLPNLGIYWSSFCMTKPS